MNTRAWTAALLVVVTTAVRADARQQGVSPFLTTVQELVMSDGSRIYGKVESETDTEVVFRTTSGATVTAPRQRIRSIRPVTGRTIDGDFRREDPNDTRLLFGPTGKALARGEAYLGVYQGVMAFAQVGVTDRFSIGGGTPLAFGFAESNRPYWVTPKLLVISHGGLHAAVGLFHGFSVAGDGLGVAYGVLTREGEAGAFTLGLGLGYTGDGHRGAVLMIGAEGPLRRHIKLITENYVWNSAAIASLGFRFFGENLSADVALGVLVAGDFVGGAPLVNFVYRF